MGRPRSQSRMERINFFAPPSAQVMAEKIRQDRTATLGFEVPLSDVWREALMRGLQSLVAQGSGSASTAPRSVLSLAKKRRKSR